ncbi:hypothetical protein HDF22_004295 [Mucilaginibacter lappiensis]|uniref:Uncharacterized protein n=1 Tax=Mucilaginibacter lappiensis TaxID=354630 RepID=A0A841JKM6_9SPHI|nr:hypothetical protein [Mucilaginibacter lappiensis]
MKEKSLNKAQKQRLKAAFEIIDKPIFSTIIKKGFTNRKALFYEINFNILLLFHLPIIAIEFLT